MSSPLASLARTMARSQPNNGRLFDVLGTLPPDHRLPFASRAHRERFSEANDRRCHEYCFGRKARLLRGFQVLETDNSSLGSSPFQPQERVSGGTLSRSQKPSRTGPEQPLPHRSITRPSAARKPRERERSSADRPGTLPARSAISST